MKTFYVYIMGSASNTLYTGMTNDITKRVYQHKNHLIQGFTQKYNVIRLLYFETFRSPSSAINREKQIKKWRRQKKLKLIQSTNPNHDDLAKDWYD